MKKPNDNPGCYTDGLTAIGIATCMMIIPAMLAMPAQTIIHIIPLVNGLLIAIGTAIIYRPRSAIYWKVYVVMVVVATILTILRLFNGGLVPLIRI